MKKLETEDQIKITPLPHIILWLVGLVLSTLAIGYILQSNKFSLPFDGYVYGLFDKIPHTPVLNGIMGIFDQNFLPIGYHPQYMVIMVIVPVIYVAIKKPKHLWWIIMALALGGIISRIMVYSDTALVFRQRPYTVLPNHVSDMLKHNLKGWTSFPSGHTRDTLMLGLIISYFLPKLKYFMIFLALLVGFSRIYYGVHFPTDVLIGLVIGYVSYIIAVRLTEYIKFRVYNRQGSM